MQERTSGVTQAAVWPSQLVLAGITAVALRAQPVGSRQERTLWLRDFMARESNCWRAAALLLEVDCIVLVSISSFSSVHKRA